MVIHDCIWRPQYCCLAEDRYYVSLRNISCLDQLIGSFGCVQPVISNYFCFQVPSTHWRELPHPHVNGHSKCRPRRNGRALDRTQHVLEAFVCVLPPHRSRDAWAYVSHSGNKPPPHAVFSLMWLLLLGHDPKRINTTAEIAWFGYSLFSCFVSFLRILDLKIVNVRGNSRERTTFWVCDQI